MLHLHVNYGKFSCTIQNSNRELWITLTVFHLAEIVRETQTFSLCNPRNNCSI